MSLCIPTYMLASSMIDGGMNWRQAIFTIMLGNLIVLIPMLLNGHAGAKYGVPFPVLARSSFGIRGANIPALLRAFVACGWFGIQTSIGGAALNQILHAWFPDANLPDILPGWVGIATVPAICFMVFWLLNMIVVYYGVDAVKKLLGFKAIILPFIALGLLVWAVTVSDGLGPILAHPGRLQDAADFYAFFFPALTGVVGFWATVSLNIPDFTRYAKSQKSQVLGQALTLPIAMTSFAFIGVVVTSATTLVFGETIWDPIALASRIPSPALLTAAMFAVVVSTLATNIAANIVSPANDFANLSPKHISFKTGGLITGVIGILIMPWKLIADPTGYIFTWLVAYSGLLGPIGAIMIVDYFLIRHRELNTQALYQRHGVYWYEGGFNRKALIALILGILPNIAGFLGATKIYNTDDIPPFIMQLYHYAWFVGFFVAGAFYWLLSKKETSDV